MSACHRARHCPGQGFAGFWNPDGSGAFLNAIHSESDTRRDNLDISVSGPLQLFGREHQLMAGFNGYRSEITDYTFSAALGNCTIAGVAPWGQLALEDGADGVGLCVRITLPRSRHDR